MAWDCETQIGKDTELCKNIPAKFRESPTKCSAPHPKNALWRNITASHSLNLPGRHIFTLFRIPSHSDLHCTSYIPRCSLFLAECPRTNDRMQRFACPTPDFRGRYRCIDDRALCNGFFDCPGREDEKPDQCLFFKTVREAGATQCSYLITRVQCGPLNGSEVLSRQNWIKTRAGPLSGQKPYLGTLYIWGVKMKTEKASHNTWCWFAYFPAVCVRWW